MILHIKNMMSLRCRMVVRNELLQLGVDIISLNLGTVQIAQTLSLEQFEKLKVELNKWGLDLIEDKKNILIEKIKSAMIEFVDSSDKLMSANCSNFISEKLGYDYTYLSNLFSSETGQTIKQFLINYKIQKVKMLLSNGMSLTEIAYALNYSSVPHLSNQFKKMTGMTSSEFRESIQESRPAQREHAGMSGRLQLAG